jgi:hypothetical protein
MTISTTLSHCRTALFGAVTTFFGLLLFNLNAGRAEATMMTVSGALLLLLANPNSIPFLNRVVTLRKKPRVLPLPQNELSQIAYNVRHAPRPGRLL